VDTGPTAVVADHYEGDDLHRSSEIERWSMFDAAVVERSSVRAVFALPLQWGAVNLGVLDLYRREPGALDDEHMRDAISAADTAALMMLGLRTDPDHGGRLARSRRCPPRRNPPGHGMVSVQLDVSASQALARMRAHAFVHVSDAAVIRTTGLTGSSARAPLTTPTRQATPGALADTQPGTAHRHRG
jgi:hypothetical protein